MTNLNQTKSNGFQNGEQLLERTEIKHPTTLLSLEEIVNNRHFVIPEYQRGYSWEEEQWDDLKKDIQNLYGSSHRHYTGTIVATDKNPENKDAFEIVDGQQRLTTLMILLREIVNVDSDKYQYVSSTYLQRGAIGEEILVLEPNRETRQFYKDVIVCNGQRTPEMKSHQSLLGAKHFFREWLDTEPAKVDEILEIATKRLGFIFFAPDYEKEIGIMFEVINNRGKSLSQLEKIKNYLIYWATIKNKNSLRTEINERWVKIQQYLNLANKTSNQDENRFLRYCYLVYFDVNKEKSWDVYQQLKLKYDPKEGRQEIINDHTADIGRFLKFLEDSAQYFSWFHKDKAYSNHTGNSCLDRIDKALKQLRCHPANASIMPLYLAIMARQDNLQRVADLLELLEKTNFRVYVLPKITSRADSKQGHTFWLAHAFYWDSDWQSSDNDPYYSVYGNKEVKGDIFDWLEIELAEFTMKFCPEKKFIQALTLDEDEADDYYRWNGIRFFLANYEAERQREVGKTYDVQAILIGRGEEGKQRNDHLSLEHIWAQNNRVDDFPSNHIQKRRLGNFVLLGLSSNISLSDKDVPKKVKELNDINSQHQGALHMVHVADVVRKIFPATKDFLEKWSRKTKGYYEEMAMSINDQRETDMVKFALDRWAVNGEKLDRFEKVDSFLARKEKRNESYILNADN